MKNKSPRDLILDMFTEKSCMKQDVFHKTIAVFEDLKDVLEELVEDLGKDIVKKDDRLVVEYSSTSKYEARIKFGGDILIFHMHTNVFKLNDEHPLMDTSYLKEDPLRAYCGIINIYNFLADSFKYNRINDSGYLVARIFMNDDKHYFVEGKRQLGFLYNDFVNAVIDKKALKSIAESAILYALDFDLLTPPYENMKLVSVHQMQELSENMKIATGKRLGFQFQADNDIIH